MHEYCYCDVIAYCYVYHQKKKKKTLIVIKFVIKKNKIVKLVMFKNLIG